MEGNHKYINIIYMGSRLGISLGSLSILSLSIYKLLVDAILLYDPVSYVDASLFLAFTLQQFLVGQ